MERQSLSARAAGRGGPSHAAAVALLVGAATLLVCAQARAQQTHPPVPLDFGQNKDAFFAGLEGEGPLVATLETTAGPIRCALHEQEAPVAVANFVGLARGLKPFRDAQTQEVVRRPFYDGLAFHRVIANFIIQAGDPTGSNRYNPGYRFKNEITTALRHDRPGVLAMANSGPDTNGSQFYITLAPTPFLDGKYTIFGQCEELDVLREIAAMPTGPLDRPLQPVLIQRVTFKRGGEVRPEPITPSTTPAP